MNAEPLRWFNVYQSPNNEITFRGFPDYKGAYNDFNSAYDENGKRKGDDPTEIEGPYSAREILQRFGSKVFDEQRSSVNSFHQVVSYLRDEPLTNDEKMERAFAYGAASAEHHYSTYASSLEHAMGLDRGAAAARGGIGLENERYKEGLSESATLGIDKGTPCDNAAFLIAKGAEAEYARENESHRVRNGGFETQQEFVRSVVSSENDYVAEWLADKRADLRPQLLGKNGRLPGQSINQMFANPDKEMAVRYPEIFRAGRPVDVANNLSKNADRYFFRAEGIKTFDQAYRAGWDAARNRMGRYVDSLERAAGIDTQRPFDAVKFDERHLNNMYRQAYIRDEKNVREGQPYLNTVLRGGMKEFAVQHHDKIVSRQQEAERGNQGVQKSFQHDQAQMRERSRHFDRGR